MFVITDPIGKSIFFLLLTQDQREKRVQIALTVCTTVAIILGAAALIGQQLLDVMGIHLGAFGFTGGLIVAGMGLEMLGTGQPSRAQGSPREDPRAPPDDDDSLFVPFGNAADCWARRDNRRHFVGDSNRWLGGNFDDVSRRGR